MADGDQEVLPEATEYPRYKEYETKWTTFLQEYRDIVFNERGEEQFNGDRKYAVQIAEAGLGNVKRISISLDDVLRFGKDGPAFVKTIESNARRHISIAQKAIDKLIREARTEETMMRYDPELVPEDADRETVYMAHRIAQAKKALRQMEDEGHRAPVEDVLDLFPPALLRTYELYFEPRTTMAQSPVALREVRGEHLGKYVTVKAIVLRVSDVRACLTMGSYTCEVCGFEIFQDVVGKSFMPVTECMSASCTRNGNTGKITMQTRASKFEKFQELKIQELPEQVPVGHIPRTMTVHCRGDVTRTAGAGDVVLVGGIFVPTPYTGYQAIRAGLTADTYLDAHYISRTKKTASDHVDKTTADKISELAHRDRAYEELSASIAPEIYGHEDVKKALLLQLVGGVTNVQKDGMKTRGDINICLMGDPGVAKSQLLKHIARSAPRAVYTTGKGSSGVGLTAAVIRDPVTQELALEGGALVLADMGICCIDEFDKMEESDRTAIHEVMEQQTVSIAKAGITTTLNARTAILAAANPRYGRYNAKADRDPYLAMVKNINLPAALLSRFDLMFVLRDEIASQKDQALAEHITYVHMYEETPAPAADEGEYFSSQFIRQYVAVAKHIHTTVPKELTAHIVNAYVEMRGQDKARADQLHNKSTTTARQLLSILRLAEARARLCFSDRVRQEDIEEAIRLIKASKAAAGEGAYSNVRDHRTALWQLFQDLAAVVPLVTFQSWLQAAETSGYTRTQVEETIEEYETLGIVAWNVSHTALYLVEDKML